MNMKRAIALLLTLCMALCLCACGNKEDADPGKEEQPTDAAVQPTEAPTEAPAEAPAGTVYTVYVQDEGGNPIAGAMVQVCQGELCLMPTPTGENGAAVFTVAEEGQYEAKFLALPEGYDYTTEEQVFHFGNSFELTITLKAVA